MKMSRSVACVFGLALLLPLASGLLPAAPVPQADAKKDEKAENKNTLVEKYRKKLTVTASTFYQGYPAENVIDGDKKTAWFSGTGDSAAKDKAPWLLVAFPEDVTVKRLTVLGNRDATYPTGYSVLTGFAEFLDADGKVLWSEERDAAGDEHDFEFMPKEKIAKVRSVRFTSRKDQGNDNGSEDVAIAELMIE